MLLYYITDRRGIAVTGDEAAQAAGLFSREREEALVKKIAEAFAAGVDYLQLREKDLPGRRLAALVKRVAALPRGNSRLLVNERLDIAAACGADGAHLPSHSAPPEWARNLLPKPRILGLSCHNREDLQAAERAGADYALLGPVFATPSKPGAAPLGLAVLRELCASVSVPVIALGGIERNNAAQCRDAGAAGVAGIRMFQEAPNIAELCRALRSA